MKKFDIETTKYEGLWYDNKTHRYSSASFDLSELRDYKGAVRIVMWHNRAKEKGDNKPNYVFRIVPASEQNAKLLQVERMKEGKVRVDANGDVYKDGELLYTPDEVARYVEEAVNQALEEREEQYTYDQVQYAIEQAAMDGYRGYTDVIVRDYLY